MDLMECIPCQGHEFQVPQEALARILLAAMQLSISEYRQKGRPAGAGPQARGTPEPSSYFSEVSAKTYLQASNGLDDCALQLPEAGWVVLSWHLRWSSYTPRTLASSQPLLSLGPCASGFIFFTPSDSASTSY